MKSPAVRSGSDSAAPTGEFDLSPEGRRWQAFVERRTAALGRNLRFLAAEDNELNRRVLALMVGGPQVEIEIVNDGQAAIDALKRGAYDLVLFDINMPKLDGVAAIAAIRGCNESYRDVPAIAVTAFARDVDRKAALAAGMTGFVAKPFRRGQILTAIVDALDKPE